jgi:NAD(P)-dependent dehydrogenase (short-subunit alcohol dehydrogenase family)
MTVREAWNKTYDINVTGTHILTETLVPLLLKSSEPRLMFVTSGLSSINEASDERNPRNIKPPAGWPKPAAPQFIAYRTSKAGLNMMMVDWYKKLYNDNVKVRYHLFA